MLHENWTFTDTYPPYINGVSTSVLMLRDALEKLGAYGI